MTAKANATEGDGNTEGAFDAEERLPRLPVPTLDQSCRRFLEWCAPLLTADELAKTRAAVAEFGAAESPVHAVQRELEAYAKSPEVHSWLDDFWRSRYLGRRDRIALNANFFFLFTDSESDQLKRAAGIISGAVRYHLDLDSGRIPATSRRGQPLSMNGQHFLFSSTRIPGVEIDSSRGPYTADWPGPSAERQVIVFVRGAMYRLDVIAPDGQPYAIGELERALSAIRSAAPRRGQSVGQLTTLARAEWAGVRERLLAADAENPTRLDAVERALFCLALEDDSPADPQSACAGLLAGDSGSRWFDKAMTFIVYANGTAGINGEHCNLDGTTVIDMVDTMTAQAEQGSRTNEDQGPGGFRTPNWEPIEFGLDDDLRRRIADAGKAFDDYAAGNAMMLRRYDSLGTTKIKECGVSPDAFLQVAFQLAHRRVKKLTGATYESVSTRHFHHGRTEAMRVVTPEMINFVDAMQDPDTDATARRELLDAAVAAHVSRAKQCQAGDAPEQHLWELQLLAGRRGMDLPSGLYESPGWTIMRDDYLSTSAVPSVNIQAFGFGATSEHCIGCAYLPMPDAISVYLATPRSVADQLQAFADALPAAFDDLVELLR